MDCTQITKLEFAERYLLGKLAPEERDAYERHYFECTGCFEELQHLLAIQGELRATPLRSPAPQSDRRTFGTWWGWPAFAGAAAALLAIVILLPHHEAAAPTRPAEPMASAGSNSARAQLLAALAHVNPPPYQAPVLRGMHDAADTAFREGMKDYLAGGFTSAAVHLREAATVDPSRPDIAFYLGAAELLTGRPHAAQIELQRAIAMGETAFTEEAHFYLGKALLRQNRLAEAAQEFARVASMGGPLRAEAKILVETLAELAPAPKVH